MYIYVYTINNNKNVICVTRDINGLNEILLLLEISNLFCNNLLRYVIEFYYVSVRVTGLNSTRTDILLGHL